MWRVAEELQERASDERHGALAAEFSALLRGWGERWAGDAQWKTLLDKSSLMHEVEETVVATMALLRWLESDSSKGADDKITVVDVCSGKGFFGYDGVPDIVAAVLTCFCWRAQHVPDVLSRCRLHWRRRRRQEQERSGRCVLGLAARARGARGDGRYDGDRLEPYPGGCCCVSAARVCCCHACHVLN